MGVKTAIPITVFTGFLGAGKTTIILSLLEQLPKDYQVVLLKNEFGDVEVDSQLASNSSLTAMKTALLEIRDKYRPDRIIIESSGSAFPATLAFQIRELERETEGDFKLDAIVTVVDAENFRGYEDTSPTAKMQAQYTDVILINKWEHCLTILEPSTTSPPNSAVKASPEFPTIYCLASTRSNSWIFPHTPTRTTTTKSKPRRYQRYTLPHAHTHDHGHNHDHGHSHDEPSTRVEADAPLTRDQLTDALGRLPKDSIYRVKGFVRFRDQDPIEVLNWAFGRFDLVPCNLDRRPVPTWPGPIAFHCDGSSGRHKRFARRLGQSLDLEITCDGLDRGSKSSHPLSSFSPSSPPSLRFLLRWFDHEPSTCLVCTHSSRAASASVLPRSLTTDGASFASETYDYIIVGGGTAGLAVAARLAENSSVTVGVVEAGQYIVDDPLIDTPQLFSQTQGNPKYDWMFESVAQPGLNNRVMAMPRGKVLGGSSALNYMAFDRASKAEYDGWNWNGIVSYMKVAEDFTNTDPFRNSSSLYPSQGIAGPIGSGYNTWYSDVTPPYRESLANLGIPTNLNPDSGDAYGLYNCAMTVNRTTGKRSYSASTYYAYSAQRSNLVVLTGGQATKINFSNKTISGNHVATGVSFVSDSNAYTVNARRKSFFPPDRCSLHNFLNSAVSGTARSQEVCWGESARHVFIPTSYELKPGKTTFDILRNNATFAAEAQAQYAILTDYLVRRLTTSMKTKLYQEIADLGTTALERAQFAIQKTWLDKKLGHTEIIMFPGYFSFSGPKANASYISMLFAIQHPFSRGNIHIGSADPLVKGVYDPKYFSNPLAILDLQTLVEAVKFGMKISKTEPLASSIVARQDPAPEVTSDEDIAAYIKTYVESVYHPIGTAALAPKALGGVVDNKLKVYGTTNVRVVDASVIPIHMGTHITRTIYGIGEKAAALIKSGN
ncbi:GMC oxidoreductase [Rhizoctonia solani]|uniref:GMC oxidoreductase n=1 Tax=Rhizoctonia solani TaxID=456999 RepID=A0A8H8NR02_9AGAM|nr:GMC oxidoreductase [Rhizoctonia solani]QRW18391.1 GMC oxidoreductase [Rhizoctonia solani]